MENPTSAEVPTPHLSVVNEPPTSTRIDRDQFTAYLVMQELANASIRCYSAMFVRWVDWAISNGADPYRPGVLEVRAWSRTINGTRSSLAHARTTIRHLCEALEVDDVSPAVHLPRSPKRVHRGLDEERVGKLATYALTAGTKGLAVLVGLYTAARISEIASLAWRRVDIEGRLVTLERPKTRDLHTVPLHPVLRRELAVRRLPDESWVFPGRYRGHISPARAREWIAEVAEAAGVGHVTPHQLRHTALSTAYHSTKDLRAVQDLAGHTKVETTVLYTEVHRDRLNAAVMGLTYGAEEGGDE